MAVDDILTNLINDIQALNRTTTGVQAAPALNDYPTVIDTADLPLVITWPGAGTWHHKGMGGAQKRQDRSLRVLCFVDPLGQNDIPSRAAEGVVLLQRLINLYLNPDSVPVTDPTGAEPYQITIEEGDSNPHSDSGLVSNLSFAGKSYSGFEIKLRARVLW